MHLRAWLTIRIGEGALTATATPQPGLQNLLEMIEGTARRAIADNGLGTSPENMSDLFEVLGVVRSLTDDLDGAAAAFRSALRTRRRDHALWNKLGAMLANVGRPEDALEAYVQAIAHRPRCCARIQRFSWISIGA